MYSVSILYGYNQKRGKSKWLNNDDNMIFI